MEMFSTIRSGEINYNFRNEIISIYMCLILKYKKKITGKLRLKIGNKCVKNNAFLKFYLH